MQLTDFDSYLFHEGTNYEIYKKMGAHICEENGVKGVYFAVWAPNAAAVSVVLESKLWDKFGTILRRGKGGVWELFVPGIDKNEKYRFAITGKDGITRYKADPYAFYAEQRPNNASVVWSLDGYEWQDGDYMDHQAAKNGYDMVARPMAIYEVHLGSWKKDYSLNKDGFLNYRRLADELSEYVTYMGFTHVELIGICEHPFDGSWGYQVTGYYAPTSRYGTPDDFRYFVDKMHQCGIGVILDWVPAHFPKDAFGLEHFDGTNLYEPTDPTIAEYPEWGTMAFDHGKPEVRSFLIGNAFYWIKEFHIDGLRVDAVAAMLFRTSGRPNATMNQFGGIENLESIAFLKQLNSSVNKQTRGYIIAEDSSIMAGMTTNVDDGGIGFTFKWNMGWMNDTLKYFAMDPVFRGLHHEQLTGTFDYSTLEHFVLVLSHDEVVHLKKPMLLKMPGSPQDQYGELKTLYTEMFTMPGKKLLFMGQEFAENHEWDEKSIINWGLSHDIWHRDVMECVRSLQGIYRRYPCLYDDGIGGDSLEWVNKHDAIRSTISYIRKPAVKDTKALLIICNMTPIAIHDYAVGAPLPGGYRRVFSTYDSTPGGGNPYETEVLPIESIPYECDGKPYTLLYNLRPFESVIFEIPDEVEAPKKKAARKSTGRKSAKAVKASETGKKETGKKATRKKSANTEEG